MWGQQTIITVPCTVTDNTGATSTANPVITVTGTNDAPVANANTVAATEDTALTITPATPSGQRHRHRQRHHAEHHQRAGCGQRHGGAGRRQRGLHARGQLQRARLVHLHRLDGNGGTSTATVTVNVAAVNDAPVAQAASFTVAEDAAIVNGAVTATDADAGRRSPLRSTARPRWPHVQQQQAPASTPPTRPTSRSASGQQTIITVPYTVTDNAGATSTANLVITVTGTNDAPVANADTAAASETTR